MLIECATRVRVRRVATRPPTRARTATRGSTANDENPLARHRLARAGGRTDGRTARRTDTARRATRERDGRASRVYGWLTKRLMISGCELSAVDRRTVARRVHRRSRATASARPLARHVAPMRLSGPPPVQPSPPIAFGGRRRVAPATLFCPVPAACDSDGSRRPSLPQRLNPVIVTKLLGLRRDA